MLRGRLPAALGAWPQASARLEAANVFTMAHKAVPGGRQPCKHVWYCGWQPLPNWYVSCGASVGLFAVHLALEAGCQMGHARALL